MKYNLNFLERFQMYLFEEKNLQKANQEVFSLFRNINYWLTQKEPWKIKENTKEPNLQKNQIIRLALEQFFLDLHFLWFIIPNKTLELVKAFPVELYSNISLV